MEYIIRPCRKQDLKKLVELCKQHAAYEQAHYECEGKEEKLATAIFADPPKLHCLIVESDGQAVGYASYTFDFSTWEAALFLYLDCLYLEEKYRGWGIGEAMIKKLLTIAQEKGCANMQWQTPVFNERAIRFYKRIGGEAKDKARFTVKIS